MEDLNSFRTEFEDFLSPLENENGRSCSSKLLLQDLVTLFSGSIAFDGGRIESDDFLGLGNSCFQMERISAESPYIEALHAFSANKISGVIEADAAMRPVKRGRLVGGQG